FLHDRRRLSDADVNEVRYVSFAGDCDGFAHRHEVDSLELRRFRGARMRDAYELDERVSRLDVVAKGLAAQSVARNAGAPSRKPAERRRARQRTHSVATRE